jgi:ABC-type dipeptide/oligopeptide/nickel transport system ATPase subunit
MTTLTTQIPQDFVQEITKERGVSNAELETVFMALEGQPTAMIASKLGISDIAVRKRLGEVYKKFRIGGNGPGKLAELRHQLLVLYQVGNGSSQFMSGEKGITSAITIAHHYADWGEAPDLPVFYGRTEELAELKQAILSDGCRLVSLFGLSGSGKTTLAVKTGKLLQHEFEFIIWRSLRGSPCPEDFIANLISIFSRHKISDLPISLNARIALLVEYLQKHRCLLILDDFEMLFSAGDLAGRYRPGLEGYKELIARLGAFNHNSCVFLIGAEEPTELALLSGQKVRSIKTLVSEEIVRELFSQIGLSAKEKDWKNLMSRYGSNLLAFRMVGIIIQDFFEGNVANFLEATDLFIEDHTSHLLSQQFARLSNSEIEIMYWLAIAQNPLSLIKLREDILVKSSLSDLLKNLESLSRRSLIEKISDGGETLFTLNPLIMKYVSTDLVEQLRKEVLEIVKTQGTEKMRLLKTHYFGKYKTRGRGLKAHQSRSILSLVKNRLQALFMQTTTSENSLNILAQVALTMQDKSSLEVGYAAENIRNILAEITNF